MRSRDKHNWQELSNRLRNNGRGEGLRMAILAAHPDDEAIGASTLLVRFDSPTVIYLTDGAPRNSNLWSPDFRGSRDAYQSMRRSESEKALRLAGLSSKDIRWLGAVDQEAILNADHLSGSLAELLSTMGADVLITHPYEGGHPDHDAAALVAHLAIHRSEVSAPLLLEMTSYHAQDGRCTAGNFLNGDTAQELHIHLSEAERTRKAGMFAAYGSQRRVLEGFPMDREHFRIAPGYDFSRPPHPGKLWYECMAWPMTGQQWRAIAAKKIAGVQEISCH